MTKPKKLIEVAMPIKEISAESVRDKSIRHGHISTLHLWWARRPLPVCRAVVFASLVPDPLDEYCPEAFKDAVELLLGAKAQTIRDGQNPVPNVYKPYEDIPHTAIVDKMDDNLRTRLMMFIGKFSDKYVQDEKLGKKTPAKNQLSDYSLIKWDNKNDEHILNVARKLIFVAHNAASGKSCNELTQEFDQLYQNIKVSEKDLYETPDRHLPSPEVEIKEEKLQNAIQSFLSKMPKVFDPFAGGGAIPLEAARLGCNSYGNDINPVAHIIQKGSCEFPQKFGKSITYSKAEFIKIYGEEKLWKEENDKKIFGDSVHISNRLAYDVNHYVKLLLNKIKASAKNLYPKDSDGDEVVMYYWARTANCGNPTCNKEIPLVKQTYISKKRTSSQKDWLYLKPFVHDNDILFEIKKGKCDVEPWIKRGNLICPACESVTGIKDVKSQFIKNETSVRGVFYVVNKNGKRVFKTFDNIAYSVDGVKIDSALKPHEPMPVKYTQAMPACTWGISKWGDLFLERQLKFIDLMINEFRDLKFNIELNVEYKKVIMLYLGLWIDRVILKNTSFGKWHILQETVEHLFGRQAISMAFDFPEVNPISDFSGNAENQMKFILNVINEESINSFGSNCINSSSGDKLQFEESSINCVVTDPPYYDAIAYGDLSDFFYIWLKRILGNDFPITFAYPLTPKTEECTALKHRHNNDLGNSFSHFENKLLEIFKSIEYQTSDIVSIMFAHQSTKAWTTLCNSILNSSMNIKSSWASDTEKTVALKTDKDFLATSVTVACTPSEKFGYGDYKEVQKEIIDIIKKEVEGLYALGFRGADLLTACFGKAVSVFGKYESVEKADGSEVSVAELLDMAKNAAFQAIISDIDTDDATKFYIGWLNLFGFSEAVHDDVRRITQIGLSLNINEIYNQFILIKEKDKGRLGTMEDRILADKKIGLRPVNNTALDIAHRMMYLWKQANRAELLNYIANKAATADNPVWRVVNSLRELLPISKDIKDLEYATGLMSNQENLLREAKNRKVTTAGEQIKMDLNES